MRILKQTESKLWLESKKRQWLHLPLIMIPLPFFSWLIWIGLVGLTGQRPQTLLCNRIEQTQKASCHVQTSSYFGLITAPPTLIESVRKAKFSRQDFTSSEGKTRVYGQIELLTDQEPVMLMANRRKNDAFIEEMQSKVGQVNYYLQNLNQNQIVVPLRLDSQWADGLIVCLVLGGFILFVWFMILYPIYWSLKREILKINKDDQDTQSSTLVRYQATLFGTKETSIALDNYVCTQISHIPGDSDKPPEYRLYLCSDYSDLVFCSQSEFLLSTRHTTDAQQVKATIDYYLGWRSLPKDVKL